MTEQDIIRLGNELSGQFTSMLPANDPDEDVRTGSFLFAHDGTASAARQLRCLEALEPRTIIEIGTGKGVGAVALASIAERVITVDIGWYPLRQAIWDWAGVADKIAQIIVPSDPHKVRVLAELSFDVAIVDGDHSVNAALLDFQNTRRCRRVLFHDYTPPYDNGPLRVLHDLRDRGIGKIVLDPPFGWWLMENVP